jgi:hypothetical protein
MEKRDKRRKNKKEKPRTSNVNHFDRNFALFHHLDDRQRAYHLKGNTRKDGQASRRRRRRKN